ncbi:MAG: hypothetical protein OEV66_06640 [Spirochaetia bacterium]|nr:hypothetical protein [Spirochaetia bacterium]
MKIRARSTKFKAAFFVLLMVVAINQGCDKFKKGKSESDRAFQVSTLARLNSAVPGVREGSVFYPTGLTIVDKYIYVTDSYNHVIYKVSLDTGAAVLYGGSPGVSGFSNGLIKSALFYRPFGICNDGKNLYVADSGNNVVRKIVLLTGEVSTFIGNPGVSGGLNGEPGTALLNHPQGVAIHGANLYIADTSGATIRKADMITRDVKNAAGLAGVAGRDDGSGKMARFNTPRGVAADEKNLYIADSINGAIRKVIIENGEVSTLAGVPFHPGSTDGKGSWAAFNNPSSVIVDGDILYIADTANSTIRKLIISTGQVTTIAGNPIENGYKDDIGEDALFNTPSGIVMAGTRLYVADTANHAIRLLEMRPLNQ